MKLSSKDTIFIASILVMIASGCFFYFSGQKLLTDQILKELDTVATIQEERIVDLINDNSLLVREFSSRLLLKENIAKYENKSDAATLTKINGVLEQARLVMNDVEDIYILDSEGKVIFSTDDSLINTSYSNEEFFLKGKKEVDVTSFLYKNKDKVVRQRLVSPLIINSDTIGVVVIEKTIEPMKKLFTTSLSLGSTTEWGLSKRAKNGDALMIIPVQSDVNPDSPLSSTLSKDRVEAPVTQALLKNERTFTDTVDYKGIPVLSATRYIDGADWGMAVKMSKAEAYSPIIRLRNLMVLFMGVIIVSAFICYSLFDIVKQREI